MTSLAVVVLEGLLGGPRDVGEWESREAEELEERTAWVVRRGSLWAASFLMVLGKRRAGKWIGRKP